MEIKFNDIRYGLLLRREVGISDVDTSGPNQFIHFYACVTVHGQGNETSSFLNSGGKDKVDPSNFIFSITCFTVSIHDSFPGSSSISFFLVLRDCRSIKGGSCSLFGFAI